MKCLSAVGREQRLMWVALAGTTCLVGGLVVLRLIATGRPSYAFLGWNTFLAWLPIAFAIAWSRAAEARPTGAKAIAWAGAWLLFLPNAPYLVTDLQHFNHDWAAPRWYDALLFGANALNGLLLGAAGLAIGHGVLNRLLGAARAWAAIVVVCFLCGFGIYLGRFVRLNSWDVVADPLSVIVAVGEVVVFPLDHVKAWFVTLVLGSAQLLCYLTLCGFAAARRDAELLDVRAAHGRLA